MKAFHGSPKKINIIKPQLAKGISRFENQKGVFLCKTFKHAALYALGKTLKGKATFGITPRRLLIVGNKKPKRGYVYEVKVNKNDIKQGERNQLISKKHLKPLKVCVINPKTYKKNIICVKDLKELKKRLK